MKRYISVAGWIALSMLTIDVSFAAANSAADASSVGGQPGQEAQANTGIAQTPAAAIAWQAKEMARHANQKRAEERRQLELSKGEGAPPPQTATPTTTKKRSTTTKKRTGKIKK